MMRSYDEIRRAHNLLAALALDQETSAMVVNADGQPLMMAALSVLCWVLDDDHNFEFAPNLVSIKARLSVLGIEVGEMDDFKCAVHAG
jgi:hypothetical protein